MGNGISSTVHKHAHARADLGVYWHGRVGMCDVLHACWPTLVSWSMSQCNRMAREASHELRALSHLYRHMLRLFSRPVQVARLPVGEHAYQFATFLCACSLHLAHLPLCLPSPLPPPFCLFTRLTGPKAARAAAGPRACFAASFRPDSTFTFAWLSTRGVV